MSNYPQDKFTAPNISGNWRYWGNIQLISPSGITSPIVKNTGILVFNQDNLFINYKNEEFGIYRIGVMTPTIECDRGKTRTTWSLLSVNTSEDNYDLHNNLYCYKNGNPTRMVSNGGITNPLFPSNAGIATYYYEKL